MNNIPEEKETKIKITPVQGESGTLASKEANRTLRELFEQQALADYFNALAGRRQHGGPVTAGRVYGINEANKPKLFTTASGDQFLIPTESGQVSPGSVDAAPAGGSVNITNSERRGEGAHWPSVPGPRLMSVIAHRSPRS